MTRKLLILNHVLIIMSRPKWDDVNQIAVVNIYHNISFFPFEFSIQFGNYSKIWCFSSIYFILCQCYIQISLLNQVRKWILVTQKVNSSIFILFGRSNLHIVNIFDLFGNEKGIQIRITRKRKRNQKLGTCVRFEEHKKLKRIKGMAYKSPVQFPRISWKFSRNSIFEIKAQQKCRRKKETA